MEFKGNKLYKEYCTLIHYNKTELCDLQRYLQCVNNICECLDNFVYTENKEYCVHFISAWLSHNELLVSVCILIPLIYYIVRKIVFGIRKFRSKNCTTTELDDTNFESNYSMYVEEVDGVVLPYSCDLSRALPPPYSPPPSYSEAVDRIPRHLLINFVREALANRPSHVVA